MVGGLIRWCRRYAPLLIAGSIIAVVVFLGARGSGPLARLGPSASSEGASDSTGTTADATQTTGDYTLAGVVYETGDCAIWSQDLGTSDRSTVRVPCSEPHLIEVAQRFEQPDDGFASTGPDAGQWQAITKTTCGPMVESYLGYPLDPYGRFQPGLIKPTAPGWAVGDRSVWCGVIARAPGQAADDPRFAEFAGAAKGADQTLLEPVGSCFAPGTASELGTAVPCSASHVAEVTGTVDVSASLKDYPDPSGWQPVVGDECERLATAVYGGPLPQGIYGEWFTIERSSWDAGRRIVECTLSSRDAAGKLLAVVGPLRR